MVNRDLKEYIVSHSKDPLNIIYEAWQFMTDISLHSKYVIFQSNFGFCGTDTPFTCIVIRENDSFTVKFWDVDWASFKITDFVNGDKLLDKWVLFYDECIPNWQELSAREIVEHDNFTDMRYYAEEHNVNILQLSKCIFDCLFSYHDPDNYYEYNEYDGIVAVIYREPEENS